MWYEKFRILCVKASRSGNFSGENFHDSNTCNSDTGSKNALDGIHVAIFTTIGCLSE